MPYRVCSFEKWFAARCDRYVGGERAPYRPICVFSSAPVKTSKGKPDDSCFPGPNFLDVVAQPGDGLGMEWPRWIAGYGQHPID